MFNYKNFILIIFLLSAKLVQAQNLIQNGSFDSPTVSQVAFFNPGQTIGGAWLVELGTQEGLGLINSINSNYPGSGVLWPNATSGTQFVYLGDHCTATTISQNFIISSLKTHSLSFQLADFSSDWAGGGWIPGAYLVVDIVNLTTSKSVIGGPKNYQVPNNTGFKTFTLNFTPTTLGTYKIKFSSVQHHAAILDNVQIIASETLPVNGTVISPTLSNATAIEWVSNSTKSYKILFSNDLVKWFPLNGVFQGTGTTLQHFEKNDTQKKYYRVVEISN